jgi:hypothetical protein
MEDKNMSLKRDSLGHRAEEQMGRGEEVKKSRRADFGLRNADCGLRIASVWVFECLNV